MDIKDFKIFEINSIKDALVALDKSGLGTLFVVNQHDQLIGVLTDGDIRRAIIKNINIESAVNEIINTNYVSLPVGSDNEVILEKITNSVKVIPLIDENNKLVDYASINKIRKISVAAPLLNGNELAYVTECIKTNWISSQGKFVKKFEEQFSEYHHGFPSIAVSNGTVALHLALETLGIKKGDEVLVPDLTFAASVNAIIYSGAIPVLVDVDEYSWNLDIRNLEKFITNKTKAILVVHLYGNPCEMDLILAIAKKHNLLVIEDCAEALGSYFMDKPVGTFGDAATFSFYGNKTITTGEGGMVIFKDSKNAELAAILRDHGMDKTKRYWHSQIGYNYRLTNLQAAIGVAQFERLEEFVNAKRNIASKYSNTLKKFKYFVVPSDTTKSINSYWLYTFLVNEDAPFKREDLMDFLYQNGVETRPVFYPMHIMPPYVNYGNKNYLKNSQNISNKGMSLPSSVSLTEVELGFICSVIENFCSKILNV